jgi:hypothetical protein
MTEIWNKESDYAVRSKDEQYIVNVEYWELQDGVDIVIKDKKENLLHFLSIALKNLENKVAKLSS